jgi:hypothetical protein
LPIVAISVFMLRKNVEITLWADATIEIIGQWLNRHRAGDAIVPTVE